MENKLEAAQQKNIVVRILDKITDISDSAMGIAMLAVALMTMYDVIMRHFFHAPTEWAYDICVYVLIWYSFIVAGQALKDGHHIKVDVIINMVKGRPRVMTDLVAYIGVAVYSAMMTNYCFQVMATNFRMGARSISLLRAPLWIIQLGMVIGAAILFVQAVLLAWGKLKELAKMGLAPGRDIKDNPYIPLVLMIIGVVVGIFLFNLNAGLGLIVIVFSFMLVGVPIFASLGLVGSLGLFMMMGVNGLPQIATIAQKGVESYTMLAVPLFILAGNLLVEGGIGGELFDFCSKWVGPLPGGIAVATIVACAIFAAISGSSVATAAIIGVVALPQLKKYGYDTTLAVGLVAAGGTLGILIPPSTSMIIYSTITEESTGALFMGGVIPGIMMAAIFAGYAVIYCVKTKRYTKLERCSMGDRMRNLVVSIWGLLTPVIILVSIYTGFCTPTEAAAVSVVYALIVSLARGKIKPREIIHVTKIGNGSAGMIMMIVAGALIFGNLITITQVSQTLVNFVSEQQIPANLVLLIMCLLFVVLGMFLEVVSIMYITMPIVYPLMTSLGFDGIWFGVFVTLLMEMALITPPVGLNTFVIQGISKEPMAKVIKGVLPFMALLALGLVILFLFPNLATWLPSQMSG